MVNMIGQYGQRLAVALLLVAGVWAVFPQDASGQAAPQLLVGELKVKDGIGKSLHLETFNTDPNLSAIWNTLFGVDPPSVSDGIVTLQADQVVTWEEGTLQMGGVMRLNVTTDLSDYGPKKIRIEKAKSDQGTTTFVSGNGGVNPNLADGGWHEVKVKNMLDVTVYFDGETATGLLRELKVKLDVDSTTGAPVVRDFKIEVRGVTTSADVDNGTVTSVEVTIPMTTVTALAATEYEEKLKDKPVVLNGHTEAEFKREKDAVTEGVDVTGLSDGFNDLLTERKGLARLTAASPQSECAELPSGAISWWPAEGNANDIIDVNHGNLQGDTTFASGMVGQAFSFDGDNDFIDVPSSPSLNIDDTITIELWVNFNTVAGRQDIFSKWGFGDSTRQYLLIMGAPHGGGLEGRIQFWIGEDGNGLHFTPPSLTEFQPGVWYHIAGTFDGTMPKLYVNGVLETSTSIDPTNLTTSVDSLRIGTSHSNDFTDGLIDESTLYNRALTDSEIQEIYNAQGEGKCV